MDVTKKTTTYSYSSEIGMNVYEISDPLSDLLIIFPEDILAGNLKM
ncbi:hypothetical protein [Pedobacter terrae]